VKIGLFVDAAFRLDASTGRVYAGEELLGFGTFACAVGKRFDGFVLISKSTDDATTAAYELPDGVQLAALPNYGSLRRLGAVLRAIPATVRALWGEISNIDLVWVSASNPVGLILLALARLRRRKVAILVRQDSMTYFRNRLPSRRWAPLLLPLWLVDRVYRAMGRRVPTTVVGAEIARSYGAPRDNVLEFTVNSASATRLPDEPVERGWGDRIRLLTVGRIEPEKNPLLAVEALALLNRADPGRFRWTWAGEGRLREAVASRAAELGLDDLVDLPGFVPLGEPLQSLYEEAHAFVHVSLTEGVPAVLPEAMASCLPIVATDVGGVRDATGDGTAALLVPPRDAGAVAAAVRRLDTESRLRDDLARAGLDRARSTTIEAQSDLVADFLKRDM
jgi:glycosyltransferase involved in cell wall biosynthesis